MKRAPEGLSLFKTTPQIFCTTGSKVFGQSVMTMLGIAYYIQAHMPYESSENPSNKPNDPMGFPQGAC